MSHIEFETAYTEAVDSGWTSTKDLARQIWQKARSQPVGVPDGYALVPVEPTPEMLAAAAKCYGNDDDCYRVMLTFAPAAPAVKAEQVHDFDVFWNSELREELRKSCARGWAELIWKAATAAARFNFAYDASLPAAGLAVEEVEVVAYLHERSGAVATADNVRVMEEGSVSSGYTIRLMTVAQHERIDGKRLEQIAERDAAIEEWSGTAVQNGMEVDRLSAELRAVVGVLSAVQEQFNRYGERFPDGFDSRIFRWVDDAVAGHALSAQQFAPERVSVPVEWREAVKELFDAKQAKDDFERENPGNSTKRWDACLYRIEAAEDALRALLSRHGNGGGA